MQGVEGDVIIMKKVEYKVVGMTCGGCENSVKRVVSRINGVSEVTASHSLNQVVVSYDENLVNDTLVLNAMTKIGYQAEVK